MPEPTLAALRQTASDLARLAGEELLRRRSLARDIQLKGGIDLVTDADRAAEDMIVGALRERFPDHALLAEERGGQGGSAPYRWIVDPLDGTTNYAHAVPHFCVSVAVEGPPGLLAGAIFDPVRDELFLAARGEGATLNGRPIRVTETKALGQSLLATGFPYDLWERPQPPLTLFSRFSRRARGIRRMGSAALDLAYVACGRFDGFFEYRLQPWDVAAGVLLLQEAGGVATHLLGGPLDLSHCDVLASNGPLHLAMLEIIRAAVAEDRG